jgi:centrosomal CEP192-like protein
MNLMRRFVATRPPALLVLTLALTVFVGGCGGGMASTPTPTPTPTPTAGLNLSSLAFTSQTIGTASTAQTLTLTNSGTGPLSITSITISGTNSGDFVETNTCGTSLAANANCVISVTFTPTGSGMRSASLTITDNAAGSPQTSSLSGMAVAPPIVVNVSPGTANVQAGVGTQSFSATLQNDSQNKGVNWTLSGTGCSGNACGMLSASSSASGAAITYTAPATVPTPATVTLTATSISDTTKSAAATITVTAAPGVIVVTVVPTPVSVHAGGSQNFTATVQNDSQNKGVTWVLLGASCSENACGTLSTTSSASGAAIVYTAPKTLPSPATITLKATSVTDGTKSADATITVTAAPPVPVNIGPGGDDLHMIVDVNGNIDVAWLNTDDSGIFFSHSLNGGASFETTPAMFIHVLQFPNLQMGVDGTGAITLLWWVRQGLNPNGTAFIKHSTDGVTFSPSVDLGIPNAMSPQLTVDQNGRIDVTWIDVNGGIFLMSSVDGGVTFSVPKSVAVGPGASGLQTVIGPQAQIYVFWAATCEIMFSRSLDGVSFSPAVNITSGFTGGCGTAQAPITARHPAVTVDAAGDINVAWDYVGGEAPNSSELFFTRSSDQGTTFFAGSLLLSVVWSTGTSDIVDQKVAVGADGGINIIWNSDKEILFSRSLDQGGTFSLPEKISLPLGVNRNGAGNPDISVGSTGVIHASWSDDAAGSFAGDSDIYESTSLDGITFSVPVDLSRSTGQAADGSRLASDSKGNTYISWRNTTTFPNSVYFEGVP